MAVRIRSQGVIACALSRPDEFLAILGHELRNPLAPILTALQLVKLRSGPRSARAIPSVQDKRRILVVDDNEDARLLLSDILAAIGYEVRVAGDGVGALELINGFTPDIAILDIGLPMMDGYELAAKLRETMRTATPRLIALTGYGQQADQERSQLAGFDRHLVKPVDVRCLLDAILDLQQATRDEGS